MKAYYLPIFFSMVIFIEPIFSQNDYSVGLGRKGLQFIKFNSESRMILMNRKKVIVSENIIKINNFDKYVFGERSGDANNYFLLNTSDLSVLFFNNKEDLITEIKKHYLDAIVFLEPGIFAKRSKN